MPMIRNYPQAGSLLSTDAFLIDRLGVGTMYAEGLIANNALFTFLSGLTGSVTDIESAVVSGPRWYGATGNGSTDDSASLNTAGASGAPLVFQPGTYLINSAVTFSSPVTMLKGATFSGSGAPTFNGGLTAGADQIFSGSGVVTINSQKTIIGYAEWWGAKTGNSSFDSAPAIQAAVTALRITQLMGGDYYIGNGAPGVGTNLITLAQSGHVLQGVGATAQASAGATRLVINSAAATGLLVGFASSPGGSGTSNWIENAIVRDLAIVRNVGTYQLQNPASGTTNAPAGLKFQYANLCFITNVWTMEHSFGFSITATVACKLTGCRSYRFTAGTATGNDFFAGYYQDNSTATPFNSGNASLYYSFCGAFSNEAQANAPGYTYNAGIQTYQGFTDTFIDQFESANCGYGIDANGRQTSSPDYETEDLTIDGAVCDGCRWDGIRIQTGGAKTAAQIQNSYIGVSNATGPTSNGIHIYNVHGSVNIQGNQVIGVIGNPACGLRVELSSGVSARGNIYTDMQDPVIIATSFNVRVEDQINAAMQGPATAGVQVTALTRGVIDCDIYDSNASLSLPVGVDLIGSANAYVEVKCSGIDPTHITGGSANKLVSNGTQITSAGTFSTNCLASGIMA